jgi:hypothetical protein
LATHVPARYAIKIAAFELSHAIVRWSCVPTRKRNTSRDEFFDGVDDTVGEETPAQLVPQFFDRVELWAVGRQEQQRNVVGDSEALARVPAGAVEAEQGMCAGADAAADLGEPGRHTPRTDSQQARKGHHPRPHFAAPLAARGRAKGFPTEPL